MGQVSTTTAQPVLAELLEGNVRFAQGRAQHTHQDTARRAALVDSQHPDTVILSCSDSRVPPEIIFDQGIGDIFDVRTAGEILDTSVIASLEFAVEELGVKLLFVLGHEHCGAVAAALSARNSGATVTGAQSTIIEQVGKSILQSEALGHSSIDDFERAHALRIAAEITQRSPLISHALANHGLNLAVGRYSVINGTVEILKPVQE